MTNWDHVPWAIGGQGVKHSANVSRLLAYAAAGGNEGIIGTLDLEVRPLSVPGGSVRVAPGACFILNRNPNVAYDAYAARLPVQDTVAIPPTGSSSARTDLVVARIKDPYIAGSVFQQPSAADVAADAVDFVETYVMTAMAGVTPGQHPSPAQIRAALGETSAIPLASIALPASTGTVMDTHLRDQRAICQFRETQFLKVVNPTAVVSWTVGQTIAVVQTPIAIPSWATHWSGASYIAGLYRGGVTNVSGIAWMALGGLAAEQTVYDDQNSQADRFQVFAGGPDVPIPVNLRGTTQNLTMYAKADTGVINHNAGSTARLDIVFRTQPEKRAVGAP